MTLVALAGNPNSGKTTLFNRLTGLRQQVGNYPGVTVERRTGAAVLADGRSITIVDLPGTYSLVSRSRDEAIAFDALTGHTGAATPDAVVVVVDATNLERNLYLALSTMELRLPTVVAVNMMDAVEAAGKSLDLDALAEELGVPVVGISAKYGRGIEDLLDAVNRTESDGQAPPARRWRIDTNGEEAIDAARRTVASAGNGIDSEGAAVWALTSAATFDSEAEGAEDPLHGHPALQRAVAEARPLLTTPPNQFVARVIEARYDLARKAAQRAKVAPGDGEPDFTDRVDRYLLHPVIGTFVFFAVMAFVFQSIFAWSDPLMGAIEGGVGAVQGVVQATLPDGAIRDLLVDGVVGGVGNVIVFVPQIAILFALIAVLEDSGYLARAAFISDRVMARVGLHGRAFMPLLSGFACAVPAIMATRAIETRRDRLVTILVAPLVSCSARLPVYTLIIAALFAADQTVAGVFTVGGLMMLTMYLLSMVFTIGVAFILKRTILASPTPPLVLELPPYRRPEIGSVLRRAYERCMVFVRDAGTVILACSVVLWALLYFPREVDLPFDPQLEALKLQHARKAAVTRQRDPAAIERAQERYERAIANLDARVEAARVHGSFAGRIGRTMEPVIEPLGYDWKIGIGLLASFAAREVFVSTMGVILGVGGDADETSVSLRERLQREKDPDTGQPIYTPLVGLSLMVFFALALQCMSTVAAIRRETNSWRWPVFALVYTAVLAWIAAFLVYQGGRWLGFT